MTILTAANIGEHAFWIASRAAGILAIALMSFSVIVGLTMGGNLLGRASRKLRSTTGTQTRDLARIHEYTSLAALIAIASHGLLLIGDGYLHPSLSQIAVPFTIEYRPFYTGLGIVGAYVAMLLGLTYYMKDRIGTARWKRLHRFTIIGWLLAVVHVFGAGTDTSDAWLKYPMVGVCATVAVLFVLRIRSARGSGSADRNAALFDGSVRGAIPSSLTD